MLPLPVILRPPLLPLLLLLHQQLVVVLPLIILHTMLNRRLTSSTTANTMDTRHLLLMALLPLLLVVVLLLPMVVRMLLLLPPLHLVLMTRPMPLPLTQVPLTPLRTSKPYCLPVYRAYLSVHLLFSAHILCCNLILLKKNKNSSFF